MVAFDDALNADNDLMAFWRALRRTETWLGHRSAPSLIGLNRLASHSRRMPPSAERRRPHPPTRPDRYRFACSAERASRAGAHPNPRLLCRPIQSDVSVACACARLVSVLIR